MRERTCASTHAQQIHAVAQKAPKSALCPRESVRRTDACPNNISSFLFRHFFITQHYSRNLPFFPPFFPLIFYQSNFRTIFSSLINLNCWYKFLITLFFKIVCSNWRRNWRGKREECGRLSISRVFQWRCPFPITTKAMRWKVGKSAKEQVSVGHRFLRATLSLVLPKACLSIRVSSSSSLCLRSCFTPVHARRSLFLSHLPSQRRPRDDAVARSTRPSGLQLDFRAVTSAYQTLSIFALTLQLQPQTFIQTSIQLVNNKNQKTIFQRKQNWKNLILK